MSSSKSSSSCSSDSNQNTNNNSSKHAKMDTSQDNSAAQSDSRSTDELAESGYSSDDTHPVAKRQKFDGKPDLRRLEAKNAKIDSLQSLEGMNTKTKLWLELDDEEQEAEPVRAELAGSGGLFF
jgi:hypothetical protein